MICRYLPVIQYFIDVNKIMIISKLSFIIVKWDIRLWLHIIFVVNPVNILVVVYIPCFKANIM